jgi:hypothetical protein
MSAGEDIWDNEQARKLTYEIVLNSLEHMVIMSTTCFYNKEHWILTHVFLMIAEITSGYLPKEH